MAFCERLKEVIRTFGFGVEDGGIFCRTQWKLPWLVWVIYRVILAIYYPLALFLFTVVVLIEDPAKAASALLFATDWTCLLVALYFLLALVNVFRDRNHGRGYHIAGAQDVPSVDLAWRHKIQWLILNIIANFSILVSIVYWSFLRLPLPIIFDLTCHTFPSILGIIEILLTPIPIRVQHVIYPVGYGFIYLMFTLIFYLAGGSNNIHNDTAIYPGILDWAEPGNTCIAMLIIVIAMIGSQIFLWALYKARMVVVKRFITPDVILHTRVAREPSMQQDGLSQTESSSPRRQNCDNESEEMLVKSASENAQENPEV